MLLKKRKENIQGNDVIPPEIKTKEYDTQFAEIETKIVAAGISRFATLCFQWNQYGSIEKWHTQNKSKYFTKCSIKHQED